MNRTLGDNFVTEGGKRQFTDGPPGTTIDADHMNAVQEELMTVIANAGISPSSSDLTQVYQAIMELSGQGNQTITDSWEECANPKNIRLRGIAWNGSMLVAVGSADGVDSYIITSTDDGKTWTERAPTVAKNLTLYSVCWNGSMFVAVGEADGVDAYIVTSTDGITWTERVNPKNFDLYAVCWSPQLKLFVAVGEADGGDAYIVTSADGIAWVERANPKNFGLSGIAWGVGLFVAGGTFDGTDAYLVYSTDGITWTEQVNPITDSIMGVGYGDGMYVTVSSGSGNARIMTSYDGHVWTLRPTPYPGGAIYDVVWSGFMWVAVGNTDGTWYFHTLTSADGMHWRYLEDVKGHNLDAIVWTGDRFVAVGWPDGSDAYLLRSAAISYS